MKHMMYPEMLSAKPNPAHLLFASLHQQGKLEGVVTQNIDWLHQRSGVPHDKVLEVHGTMCGLVCSDHPTVFNPWPFRQGECDYRLTDDECRLNNYFEDTDVPNCPKCQCPLRSETVMFEQPMPEGYTARATETVANADLLFVIGCDIHTCGQRVLESFSAYDCCVTFTYVCSFVTDRL